LNDDRIVPPNRHLSLMFCIGLFINNTKRCLLLKYARLNDGETAVSTLWSATMTNLRNNSDACTDLVFIAGSVFH